MHIFVHRNDEQLGPFTEAEVRAHIAAGGLSAASHVWWEGEGDWVPLGDSALFAPVFSPTPPPAEHHESFEKTAPMPHIEPEPEPAPGPEPEPEPKPTPQKRRRSSSSRPKAKGNLGLIIGGIITVVVILGALAYYFLGTDSQEFNTLLNPAPQPTVAPTSDPSAPAVPSMPSQPQSAAPATSDPTSPMPTPMMTSPQLTPAPRPPTNPLSDPATNAAPPLSPSAAANQ